MCHTILSVLDVGEISKSAAIEQAERLPHRRGQRSECGHGAGARYRRLISKIDIEDLLTSNLLWIPVVGSSGVVISRVVLIQINNSRNRRVTTDLSTANTVFQRSVSRKGRMWSVEAECSDGA